MNKVVISILILLASCQTKLDPDVSNGYIELSEAQQWYFEEVIQRGYRQIEVEVDNAGRLPHHVAMLDSVGQQLKEALNILNIIDYAHEKVYNMENGELENVLIVNSVNLEVQKKVNEWADANDLALGFSTGQSASDWLYFEIMLKEVLTKHLQKTLTKSLATFHSPHVAFYEDSSVVLRKKYRIFETVEVNGKAIAVDSTDLFTITEHGPTQVILRKDQIVDGLQATEDIVLELE